MMRITQVLRLLRDVNENGMAMKTRLFVYIFSLVLVLFGTVFLFLSLFGVLSNEEEKAEMLLNSRLEDYSNDVHQSFLTLAGQGIQLSKKISAALEQTMEKGNYSFSELTDHKMRIYEMEQNTYDIIQSSIRAADCSGAFMILDTTVNSKLEKASFSRSGLYLKMINLNVSQPVNPDIMLYRGDAQIGMDMKTVFHKQWNLEFNTNEFYFFNKVLEKIKEEKNKDLKDYYFVSEAIRLPGVWERAMFVCLPVLGSDGSVYGVCGFEISELYYFLSFMKKDAELEHLTSILSKRSGQALNIRTGLLSGSSNSYFDERETEQCEIFKGSNFNTYQFEDSTYIGKMKEVKLSQDAGGEEWTTTVMIPKSDYNAWTYKRQKNMIILCILFLIAALLLSAFFSRRYVRPIILGLEGIKSPEYNREAKIPEIDNLMEFLAKQDEEREKKEKNTADVKAEQTMAATTELYQNFVSNIQLLSAAERAVFDLYMEGCTAKEIAERLFLSINTIKTHNRKIYAKLNVSSRKELMVYIRMMEEVGQRKQSL